MLQFPDSYFPDFSPLTNLNLSNFYSLILRIILTFYKRDRQNGWDPACVLFNYYLYLHVDSLKEQALDRRF